jgi:hypothetical protein
MDFTLPTGAKLVVTEAAYVDADALLKSLVRCAKGVPLPKNFLEADVTILKDILVDAITSEEVDAALFKCGQRAMYETAKVTKDLFDDPQLKDRARQDRFIIFWHLIEVNCGPFFAKTFSLLRERLALNPLFQKSSQPSTTPS